MLAKLLGFPQYKEEEEEEEEQKKKKKRRRIGGEEEEERRAEEEERRRRRSRRRRRRRNKVHQLQLNVEVMFNVKARFIVERGLGRMALHKLNRHRL